MSLDPRAVEMVTQAHKRQLALRFEVSALTAAVDAGREETLAQYQYALEWISRYAARRIMDLQNDLEHALDASRKVAAGKGGTPGRAPSPQTPQGAAGSTPTPRASRK